MPKILVVLDPSSSTAARQADLVAEGARSVRFAEVDVRTLATLAGAPDHDAILIGVDGGSQSVAAVLERFAPHGGVTDRVVAAFGGSASDAWDLLRPAATLGVIVVPGEASSDDALRALGARVTRVAEWVRHAKSHEARPGGHGHHHH